MHGFRGFKSFSIVDIRIDIYGFLLVIILALIHWVPDTDLSSYFSPLPLYCYLFSEGADDAAQYQYSCTCNRPAGNEFVVVTVVRV